MASLRTCVLVLGCAVVVGACGSGGDDTSGRRAPEGAQKPRGGAGTAPDALSRLLPPAGVPRRGNAPAVRADVQVVRAWANTLRKGDVRGAARFWAVPSRAQNATPVLSLDSRAGVEAFNKGLTCGSKVVAARRNGLYTIAKVRLTTRPGGTPDCAQLSGVTAKIAVKVRGGKIAEWYRLPEASGGGAPAPAPAPSVPGTPI